MGEVDCETIGRMFAAHLDEVEYQEFYDLSLVTKIEIRREQISDDLKSDNFVGLCYLILKHCPKSNIDKLIEALTYINSMFSQLSLLNDERIKTLVKLSPLKNF